MAGLAALFYQSQVAFAVDLLPCRAPGQLVAFESPLRSFARTVERGREIRIVALGSSSTEGTGASTMQATYPARFDQEMDRRFPGKDFQVANLGKGGELADAMLARLMHDVIPARPALVLWQTGVNDAINGFDIVAFRKILISGITALKAAGIEVVLVDPQFYPRSAGVARYEDYVAVMRAVARDQGVPVFRRYAIMKHLIASGQHSVDGLLWKDKFHLNDTSYRCLAELMAEAVEKEIRRTSTPVISAGVTSARPNSSSPPITAY
jgi:lysophospholipase L1-like esterase